MGKKSPDLPVHAHFLISIVSSTYSSYCKRSRPPDSTAASSTAAFESAAVYTDDERWNLEQAAVKQRKKAAQEMGFANVPYR